MVRSACRRFCVADGKHLFDAEIADHGGGLLGPHGGPDGRDPRGVVTMDAGKLSGEIAGVADGGSGRLRA